MLEYDNQAVLGQMEPEQWPRHVPYIGPDQVAGAVTDGEITVLAGRPGADVVRLSERDPLCNEL